MIVYVIVSGGGVESVWTTPQAAMDVQDKAAKDNGSYIAVRPIDSDEPTEESKTALLALRELQRDRHNRKAQEILEARNLRRTQRL